MEIQKYIKDKNNIYIVMIDDEEYKLHDDVIVKYNLLLNKNIDSKLLKEILTYNDEIKSYYMSIKYINKRLRSEKEIREYLHKKDINESSIDKTIELLYKNNFLNEDIILKSYINDSLNLSIDGPLKIRRKLIELGINESKIDDYLNNVQDNTWETRITNYIDKKIKLNHTSSKNMLKMKILNDLINHGYSKEMILNILNKYDIKENNILEHELLKAKEELSKKYTGKILEQKIKERLYRKGFTLSDINREYDEE